MTATWETARLRGELHLFVALDWGESINLERARQALPGELQSLPRRPRTPASIGYSPAPLLYSLPQHEFTLAPLGKVQAISELAVFDFGGVSLSWRIPFELTPAEVLQLSVACSKLTNLGHLAQQHTETIYEQLQSCIDNPAVSPATEDYLVFAIQPDSCPLSAEELLMQQASWLAQVSRLEQTRLSKQELQTILDSHLMYGEHDLFLPEWSATVLFDTNCEETLQTIEFTNLQLLEYRFIDQLLDRNLLEVTRLMEPLSRSWLPIWRAHHRSLRSLGELRVNAHMLFERTENTLKLMGDQYLARVYKMLADRFHLPEWSQSIARSLDTVESAYQVVSDQAAMYRTEFMELVVILLILIEVIMGFMRH